MFTQLDPNEIRRTAERLRDRIRARFPEAGLGRVASEMSDLAKKTCQTAQKVAEPVLLLRVPMAVLLLAIFGGLASVPFLFHGQWGEIHNILDFVQILEPALGAVFFLSALVAFLFTVEERYKRRRVLRALHELRVLAHIVDMHQLTKNPSSVHQHLVLSRTAESPKRDWNPAELGQYLNYCSEMLAIVSKMAALYVQRFPDSHAISAVDEIEGLTTGLSRKIWQKVMVLTPTGASPPVTSGETDG